MLAVFAEANFSRQVRSRDHLRSCYARSMSASRRASRGFHRLARLFVTRLPTGLVLALMLTGGAAAGPFEDGLAADDRGDYATAARLYRLAAEQDAAEAGDLYGDGLAADDRGDYATAARLYRLAAEQGLAEAQNNLGALVR